MFLYFYFKIIIDYFSENRRSTMNADQEELNKYDDLECPNCGHICKPVRILKNGSVAYQTHYCESEHEVFGGKKRHFKINVDGELVGW